MRLVGGTEEWALKTNRLFLERYMLVVIFIPDTEDSSGEGSPHQRVSLLFYFLLERAVTDMDTKTAGIHPNCSSTRVKGKRETWSSFVATGLFEITPMMEKICICSNMWTPVL
ncbi:MAG: hypothetical protein GTO24_03465 [candidate division Zixibacteria bacterium]|nr:hypothetical protein [candidate division Zixibacteria bacterium]